MECVDVRIKANGYDLKAHNGYWFQHWRRRSLAALGVTVVDETTDTR